MKRKIIEIEQDVLITCDNHSCDFKILNPTGDPNNDIGGYINMPCPECGENLLTEQDYLQSQKILKAVNWINRWFSWVTFFIPKKAKRDLVSVHCHDGVKIKREPSTTQQQ